MDLSNLKHLGKPRDVILLLRVLGQLAILKIHVRRMKLPEILGTLDTRKGTETDDRELEKMVKFSNFLLHRIFRSRNPCLLRSLLLFRYLRASGEEAPSSAAEMVRFSPRQVRLQPGATQKVRLLVRRPASLAEG